MEGSVRAQTREAYHIKLYWSDLVERHLTLWRYHNGSAMNPKEGHDGNEL